MIGHERDARRIDGASCTLPEPPPVVRGREPSISVVIPTRSRRPTSCWCCKVFRDCVTEIIVVDGRSKDGTPDIALAADLRVRLVSERRLGKGAALLSGFAAATGDAIVALDADGRWTQET